MDRYDAYGHKFLDEVHQLDDNGNPTKLYHPGLDIGEPGDADFNKNVYASAAGTVIYAQGDGGWGNHIFVRHILPDNAVIFTHYAHLNTISVKVNQQVACGQIIGKCGKTGNAKGSHVHWEIRKPIGKGYLFYPYGWSREQVAQFYMDPIAFVMATNAPVVVPPVDNTKQFEKAALDQLYALLPQTSFGNIESLARHLADLYRQGNQNPIKTFVANINKSVGM